MAGSLSNVKYYSYWHKSAIENDILDYIPEILVSDNDPQFSSEEFLSFCRVNGIHYILVTPYHPSSNVMVECAIQNFKQSFPEGTSEQRPSRLLFTYTPQHNR